MYNSIDVPRYSQFTGNYWKNVANRRDYLIKFATQLGFDPLVAKNWENIQYEEMIKQVKRKKQRRKKRGKRMGIKL